MRRITSVATAFAVIAIEAYFFSRYVEFGTTVHFWLHALLGAGAGLVVLTVAMIRRPDDLGDGLHWGGAVWVAALAGHIFSALPDLLFLLVGVIHVPWMDVFLAHISAHFFPGELLSAYLVFALALCGWGAARAGVRRTGILLAGVAVTAFVLAWAVRAPTPTTLQEVRQRAGAELLGGPGAPR